MASAAQRGERGQIATLVVVVLIVVVAVFLLQRTLTQARSINAKASNIANNGRGINISTDSIVQLDHTIDTAESILATAKPLDKQLAEVIRLGQAIDDKAQSINGTGNAINASAKAIGGSGNSINGSAVGIEGDLGQIVGIAESIRKGVAQINLNADDTIALARAIRGDTANITTQANSAGRNLGCTDRSLGGPGVGCR